MASLQRASIFVQQEERLGYAKLGLRRLALRLTLAAGLL
jgi:hypothetical protein